MANETNPGYLVQLQSPEGDNVYPVVSTQGIKNEDGSTFDPTTMLSEVGNLHVWRKTTVVSEQVPAGYTLKDASSLCNKDLICLVGSSNQAYISACKSIDITDDGKAVFSDTVTTCTSTNNITQLTNTYVRFSFSSTYGNAGIDISKVYYIPADAVISRSSNWMQTNKLQYVDGYAAVPKQTSTTYLVSDDSGAYQEISSDSIEIKYLDRLGNREHTQTVSYIGTGTYGASNQNTIAFRKKPLFVVFPGEPFGCIYIPGQNLYYLILNNTTICAESLHGSWSDSTNVLSWYHSSYDYRQYNTNGTKYTIIAVYE